MKGRMLTCKTVLSPVCHRALNYFCVRNWTPFFNHVEGSPGNIPAVEATLCFFLEGRGGREGAEGEEEEEEELEEKALLPVFI